MKCAIAAASHLDYAHDAEGKLTGAGGGASYAYDGEGRRVRKAVGGVTTVLVYDAGGRLVAEYGGAASQTSGTSYVTQDTLGSTRVVTGQGGEVRGVYDYLPFGEGVYLGRSNYGGNDIRQSEERRVGEECRSRGAPYHYKKKKVSYGRLEPVGRQIAAYQSTQSANAGW